MKQIIKQTLLVSVGINISLLLLATAINSVELAMLSLCSAALCGVGYMNMKAKGE